MQGGVVDAITTKTETVAGTPVAWAYRYDTAGRLDEVRRNGAVVATYSYDANGNRLTAATPSGNASGAYDAQDRLVTYGGATYEHNAIGQLTKKTSGGQVTTYGYDEVGNLLSVGLPDGTQVEYIVDGQNRRVGKKVNGILVQGLLWDGQLRPVVPVEREYVGIDLHQRRSVIVRKKSDGRCCRRSTSNALRRASSGACG